jgi:phytoene dehydrogenase-like protein
MSARTFDAIVIGAGHNGLVAANYLARAGRSVLVAERRPLVGGACVTEEVIPGFRASSCAYVAGLLRPQIIRELELRRFGLELYQTDVLNTLIAPDGRHLFLWKELDRTLRELDALGPREAEGFVQLGARMQRFARLVEPYLLRPGPRLSEVAEAFEAAGETSLFHDFFALSVSDLLDRYLDSDLLKGLFTFLAVVSVHGGPMSPGTAYVYGHHSWGEFDGHFGQYGFARGGMGSISEALAAGARHHGAVIRTDAPVAQVLVADGAARGVVLEDGEEVVAGLVLSNADPRRTLLSLVEPADLPGDLIADVRAFDVRGSMARVFIALEGLPDFAGLPRGEGPQHRGLTLLGADAARFEAGWDAQKRGRIFEDPAIELIVQTAHDPTLAPEGKHLISTGIQQLPFELAEGSWDDVKPMFTKLVVDKLAEYAPGLEDRIIATHTITPVDLERDYGLTGGNIFQGAMTLNQLFDARPFPGLSSYRTPVAGLYLCGAGTHPGGGVMGASGRNAAMLALGDLDGRAPVAAPRTAGRRRRSLESLMERPGARRLAVSLARRRWSRPLARLATRRRR